jgi:hypothetical protein
LSNSGSAIIIASAIGAFGTIIAGIIGVWRTMSEMRKSNDHDHGVVREKLDGLRNDVHEVKEDVKSLDKRVDDHVIWHLDHTDKANK